MIAAIFACLVSTSAFAPSQALALYIAQEAHHNGVPLRIAEAIVRVESDWNLFATHRNSNGTRDEGLWQLNSRTLRWLEVRYNSGRAINPYDPYVSTRIALRFIGDLYSVTGSWSMTLEAYNAGIGRAWSENVPRETVSYVRRVIAESKM